jgi:hypothetical protein
MEIKEPRYVAFPFGAGLAYAPHAGQFVTPAPRSYKTAAHAQLANPTGRLYVCELDEENDRLDVVAQYGSYPVTLQEVRAAGRGATAEGAIVLRDMGPREVHRWVIHYRNDQLGGYSGGNYFEDYATAVAAFAEDAARELRRIHLANLPEPAEA